MDKNLLVPYISQWDLTAGASKNDCAATSIAMVLNFYGENVTSDQVFMRTGAGQGLITIDQMRRAVESYGYELKVFTNSDVATLKTLLNDNTPVVAIVHYGSLVSRQDKTFNGGHAFVVVGYRSDGYFVNDPDFWGGFRSDGDHHFYTTDEFERSWADSFLDNNQPRSMLAILPKSTDIKLAKTKFEELVTKSSNLDYIFAELNFTPSMALEVESASYVLTLVATLRKNLENALQENQPSGFIDVSDGTSSNPSPDVTTEAKEPVSPVVQDRQTLYQEASSLFEQILVYFKGGEKK